MASYKPPTKGPQYHLRTLLANNPGADRSVLQKLAPLGDYAVSEGVSSDMYETPEQMLEDLQERQRKEAAGRQGNPQRLPAWTAPLRGFPPPAPASFFGSQEGQTVLSPQQQFAHLHGMSNQVMGAISDENDSRVAQARELRRQEHEKELMRMQMEAQKRASDAALIRELLSGP